MEAIKFHIVSNGFVGGIIICAICGATKVRKQTEGTHQGAYFYLNGEKSPICPGKRD